MDKIIEIVKDLPVWVYIVVGVIIIVIGVLLALSGRSSSRIVYNLVLKAERDIVGEKKDVLDIR